MCSISHARVFLVVIESEIGLSPVLAGT